MRRVCASSAGDDALAEEAVQAAWVIAWRKLGSVREPGAPPPWLVSVAVNEAKQLLRKRRRRAEVELTADASRRPGGIDPATGIAGSTCTRRWRGSIPDDRALLAMRYVAGFDATELAVGTRISPSGTRSRLERLLDRLRQELSDGLT